MTFSEQIVYAMFKPSKYKELIELSKKRHVVFIIVMMLVLGIVTFAVPTGAMIASFGGFEELFSNRLGQISYENGELAIDKPFKMSIDYFNVLIDTSVESISNDMINREGVIFAVGSKSARLVYSLAGTKVDYQSFELNTVLPEGFNNDMLVKLTPAIYAYLVITFLFQCIGLFVKYAVIALVLSITVNAFSKRMELNLYFGQVFMICFYGQTLGYIISNFNMAIGLLPATLVSIIAIFISIHMISSAIMTMNPRNQV